jgi:hypothetical protein
VRYKAFYVKPNALQIKTTFENKNKGCALVLRSKTTNMLLKSSILKSKYYGLLKSKILKALGDSNNQCSFFFYCTTFLNKLGIIFSFKKVFYEIFLFQFLFGYCINFNKYFFISCFIVNQLL